MTTFYEICHTVPLADSSAPGAKTLWIFPRRPKSLREVSELIDILPKMAF